MVFIKKDEFSKKIKNLFSESKIIMSKEAISRQKIRKDEHIWLYLLFIPPLGLYKIFKYNAFKKHINWYITILFVLIAILTIDTIVYPDRVLDKNIKAITKDYPELGDFRKGVRIGNLNKEYIVYNITTTTGVYDIYFSGKLNESVNAIKQISPERSLVYENKFNVINVNVHSEILMFLNEPENLQKYGEIKKIIDESVDSQLIETTNGIYNFYLKYGQICKIEKKDENNLFNVVYKNEPTLSLPKNVARIIKKREKKMGKVEKVVSYKVNENSFEYIIQMDNLNYYKLKIDNDNVLTIYNADTKKGV